MYVSCSIIILLNRTVYIPSHFFRGVAITGVHPLVVNFILASMIVSPPCLCMLRDCPTCKNMLLALLNRPNIDAEIVINDD